MDNDKIDQHSDEIEVESEEKERGKKIEIDEDRLPSRAMAIHEHIRQDGEKELERDAMALLWSAIAAGLSMGASLLAKGIFHVELEGCRAASCWRISVIPLVLLSSLWPASNYLPKTP
jgi:Formate/nitrite family of transporters